MSGFKIRIPDFEGPLDLLLFFIKRDELDIYNIPIAYITQEFLSYIRVMQMLDLELAGDFIVMAATLMQVKARMLLPRAEVEEGEEEIDPRAELTQRLLEYKRFKESAFDLQKLELDQRDRYFRSLFKFDVRKAAVNEDEDILEDVTMFHLLRAFQKAITNIPVKTVHEVQAIPWSIEAQAVWLMDRFGKRARFHFTEILLEMTERVQVVVTFIALLELIRAQRVRVVIHAQFNDFDIIRNEGDTGLGTAADEASAVDGTGDIAPARVSITDDVDAAERGIDDSDAATTAFPETHTMAALPPEIHTGSAHPDGRDLPIPDIDLDAPIDDVPIDIPGEQIHDTPRSADESMPHGSIVESEAGEAATRDSLEQTIDDTERDIPRGDLDAPIAPADTDAGGLADEQGLAVRVEYGDEDIPAIGHVEHDTPRDIPVSEFIDDEQNIPDTSNSAAHDEQHPTQ